MAPAPAVVAPAPASAGDGLEAGKRPGQRSVLLAVPANRLEAFQAALALWSEPAVRTEEAERGDVAAKGAPGVMALQLHVDPVSGAFGRAAPEAQTPSIGGAGVKSDTASNAAERQPERMLWFVVTVAADAR
jgi:hypothetical protein